MKNLVVLALGMAMLALSVPSALAADVPGGGPEQKQKAIHQSVSMVTDVDRAGEWVVVRLDGGRLLRLVVDKGTAGDDVAALAPGDFIREHCTLGSAGKAKALLIYRVRTAWMEIGSFEQ